MREKVGRECHWKKDLLRHVETYNEVTPLSMFETFGGVRVSRGGWLFHGPLVLLTPYRGGGGSGTQQSPFPKSTPKN